MQSGDMDERQQATRRGQLRFASLGLEFGAGIVGFVLVGYWIDRGFNTAPVGLITGAVLGCIGGLYVLIRRSIDIQKEMTAADERARRASRKGDAD